VFCLFARRGCADPRDAVLVGGSLAGLGGDTLLGHPGSGSGPERIQEQAAMRRLSVQSGQDSARGAQEHRKEPAGRRNGAAGDSSEVAE